MSKAGINVMTRLLAVEWAPHGIRLNAIAPGLFPTKGAGQRLNPGSIRATTMDKAHDSSAINNPMGRVGRLQELRNLATFLMADGCDYLTGDHRHRWRRPPRRWRRKLLATLAPRRSGLGEHPQHDQERQREGQGSAHGIT